MALSHAEGTRSALVVDDEESVRTTLTAGLRRFGYDVEQAADGDEAIHAAADRYYDVVVLDHLLPGMRGLEVLRWLHPPERAQAVVMVTGARMAQIGAAATRLGAAACLDKPVHIAELAAAVGQAVGAEVPGASTDPIVQDLQRAFWQPAPAQYVAAKWDRSVRTVAQHVRRETGLSLPRYIRSLRVASAQWQLEMTEQEMWRIAKHVGYGHPARLSRAFVEETGMTPTEYRRRCRERGLGP